MTNPESQESQEATVNTVNEDEIRTVTIDGEKYLIDSMDDSIKTALSQLLEIEQSIKKITNEHEFNIRNLTYSKQYLTDYIASKKKYFKKLD